MRSGMRRQRGSNNFRFAWLTTRNRGSYGCGHCDVLLIRTLQYTLSSRCQSMTFKVPIYASVGRGAAFESQLAGEM